LGHTLTGELSEGVSGSYNQREALAAAPQGQRASDKALTFVRPLLPPPGARGALLR